MSISLKQAKVGSLTVNAPGVGLMSIGGVYGPRDREESKKLLVRAVELGATFWDTADVYGAGLSESIIGEVFRENPGMREKVFVATKFGLGYNSETGGMTGKVHGDREYILQAIKSSTERLGTAPDLYYQHRVDPNTDVEETWSTLNELLREGKVKGLGISECNVETLKKVLKIADRLDALQIEYSPFETSIETNGLLETCKQNGVAVVAYSPIGRGMLSGAYSSHEEIKNTRQGQAFPRFSQENFDRNFELVKKLKAIADKKGVTPAQLSIAWVSAQDANVIPIPGTSKAVNMEANFASREVDFSADELKEIRGIIDAHETAGERYGPAMIAHVGK